MLLGASVGASAASNTIHWPLATENGIASAASLPFPALLGAMPLLTSGIDGDEAQVAAYSEFSVSDDIVLPEGYTYDIIGAWGDELGDSRFGYNNDYLSYVETAPGEGFLTINFEYISGATWLATYPEVIGSPVELTNVMAAVNEDGELDAFSLDDSDPIKTELVTVAREAMIDQGMGVISIRRTVDGSWERTFSESDRRITGISGLEDGRYLKATGPSVAIFEKKRSPRVRRRARFPNRRYLRQLLRRHHPLGHRPQRRRKLPKPSGRARSRRRLLPQPFRILRCDWGRGI